MARSVARESCSVVYGGTTACTSACAHPLKTPVGSPLASFSIMPPGGGRVSRVTPGQLEHSRVYGRRVADAPLSISAKACFPPETGEADYFYGRRASLLRDHLVRNL